MMSRKPLQYDKTYTTQEGESVGERGSLTRLAERWFSRRHPKVSRKPNYPKSRDSRLGASDSQDFPAWSVWFPGASFPEHPDNRGKKSAGQPKNKP